MEKKYLNFEEEENSDMACDPVVEYAYTRTDSGITAVHDEIDDLDWDRLPSYGPFSDEEAIARINQFEKEQESGLVKWLSSEEAWKRLYQKHPWLR